VGAAFQPRWLISRLESHSHMELISLNVDYPDKQIHLFDFNDHYGHIIFKINAGIFVMFIFQ
jgi:hypothetical protein